MHENTAGWKSQHNTRRGRRGCSASAKKKLLKNLLDSPHFHFDSNLKLPTSPARFNSINNVLLLFFWRVVDVRMPNYNSTEREGEEGRKLHACFNLHDLYRLFSRLVRFGGNQFCSRTEKINFRIPASNEEHSRACGRVRRARAASRPHRPKGIKPSLWWENSLHP